MIDGLNGHAAQTWELAEGEIAIDVDHIASIDEKSVGAVQELAIILEFSTTCTSSQLCISRKTSLMKLSSQTDTTPSTTTVPELMHLYVLLCCAKWVFIVRFM